MQSGFGVAIDHTARKKVALALRGVGRESEAESAPKAPRLTKVGPEVKPELFLEPLFLSISLARMDPADHRM
jgi:hypothetical protein